MPGPPCNGLFHPTWRLLHTLLGSDTAANCDSSWPQFNTLPYPFLHTFMDGFPSLLQVSSELIRLWCKLQLSVRLNNLFRLIEMKNCNLVSESILSLDCYTGHLLPYLLLGALDSSRSGSAWLWLPQINFRCVFQDIIWSKDSSTDLSRWRISSTKEGASQVIWDVRSKPKQTYLESKFIFTWKVSTILGTLTRK